MISCVFSDVYKLIEQFAISNPELFEKLKSKCYKVYKLKKDELNVEYLPNINKLKKDMIRIRPNIAQKLKKL